MSDTNAGGYAFPSDRNSMPNRSGMTLRDYFAAKAMQGIIANHHTQGLSFAEVSDRAWKQADAMLKARG